VNLGAFHRGIQLFNRQQFYDAHEIWEDVWRESHGHEKKFLQGLIQIAVALHHYSTDNLAGARSLLERGRRNLAHDPGKFGGIGVTAFAHSVEEWADSLRNGKSRPEFPRIDIDRD